MSTLGRTRQRTALTLERALLVALVLHGAGLLLIDRWQELLIPRIELPPEQTPIEFRFVDTPDTEPVEPPPTEVLSDRDRRAADASPRDDAADPFSAGNSPQPVLRSPDSAPPPSAAAQPRPEVTPSEATPSTEPAETTGEEEPAETAESGETVLEATARPAAEAVESPPVEPSPSALPARPTDLRRSLTRLESFVDEQIFENRDGGAQDSGSLAQFDTRGYDLGPYLRQVLRKIEGNWRSNIPPLIRTGVGGATFIALSIRRQTGADGSPVAVLVAERVWVSGQPAYDSAAQYALEISNPLPPIPDFYPHEEITGRLGFVYNLDPGSVTFPDGQ